ncbi:MAG: hypothetical protein V3R81_12300 [Gammaproteobacteria bacterium]
MASNQQVIDAVDALATTVGALCDDVKDLEQAFTGTVDGSVSGVNTRLDSVEVRVGGIEAAEVTRKRITIASVVAAITTAIGAVVTGIINHFANH